MDEFHPGLGIPTEALGLIDAVVSLPSIGLGRYGGAGVCWERVCKLAMTTGSDPGVDWRPRTTQEVSSDGVRGSGIATWDTWSPLPAPIVIAGSWAVGGAIALGTACTVGWPD